jgi:hypothetical protein
MALTFSLLVRVSQPGSPFAEWLSSIAGRFLANSTTTASDTSSLPPVPYPASAGATIDPAPLRHARTARPESNPARGQSGSGCVRKLLETVFADAKQHGGLHQTKLRGLDRVSQAFTLAMTAVNLRRLPKLFAMAATG